MCFLIYIDVHFFRYKIFRNTSYCSEFTFLCVCVARDSIAQVLAIKFPYTQLYSIGCQEHRPVTHLGEEEEEEGGEKG